MNRRVIIMTIVAVTLVAGLFAVRYWRARSRSARLKMLSGRMNLSKAETRVQVGEEILKLDPLRDTVRLKLARAYVESGRYVAARQTLEQFDERLEPHYIDAQIIRADSYLSQAKRIALQASASAEDRVPDLLDAVVLIHAQLNATPTLKGLSLTIEARRIDVRATSLRARLRRRRAEMVRARSIDIPETIETLEFTITDLRQQMAQLDKQLAAACQSALELDGQNVVARSLLFDMYLHADALPEARATAEALAQTPSTNCDAFGRAADSLINLETYHAREPTPQDIELARRLLDHDTANGPHNLSCQLTRVALALHDGQARQAHSDAQAILAGHREHSRAVCMLATAMVQLDRAPEAVSRLERYHQRVATAQVRYALGSALLAADRHQAGRQMLRQCLEQAPHHLPAYLALAQSLADDGRVLDAEPQIIAAADLSPHHRHVLALGAKLAVEAVDRATIGRMLTARQAQAGRRLDGDDLVLVSKMVLDNVQGAARLTRRRLATDDRDTLSLIADAWSRTQPSYRVAVADTVARTIVVLFDPDPLAHADPPQVRVLARFAPGEAGFESIDAALPRRLLLYENPFVNSPQQELLNLIQRALASRPDHKSLRQQAAKLAYWRGWSQRSPRPDPSLDLDRLTADEPTAQLLELVTALDSADPDAQDHALRKLLAAHPWAQQPVLIVLADALERSDPRRIEDVMYLVDNANPDLGTLTAAHVSFARGDPVDSSTKLRVLLRGKGEQSPLPRMVCDLLARAHLAGGRHEAASGVFGNMAINAGDFRFALKIAEADTDIDAQRNDSAAAALVALMADSRTPPYWMDRALVRAEALMPADRLAHLIDTMLPQVSDQPLVQLYRAAAIAGTGEPQRAGRIVNRVLRRHPDAPRALMLQARLAEQMGNAHDAGELYRKLIEKGGDVAQAARRQLQRLEAKPDDAVDIPSDEPDTATSGQPDND